MKASRWIGLAVLVVAAGAAGWAVFRPAPAVVLVTDAAAQAVMGEDAVAITLTLGNPGAPDRLVAVSSPAGSAEIFGAEGAGLVLPGGGSASLATDGAHVRVTGVEAAEEGLLIPITLRFEAAGEVTTRARLGAMAGHAGMEMTVTPAEGEPAPQLALSVEPEGEGWHLTVETEDFTFSEDQADGPHVPGVGHGHLYLNGLKLRRLYGPEASIGALPPGEHVLRVTLNANDHRTYAVGGTPVTATATITAR